MKIFFNITFLVFFILFISSCQEEYDPIGNNKPLPILKIDPSSLAFNGDGGESMVNIETNASSVEILSAPSWASATLNEDLTQLMVSSQTNDDAKNIRSGAVVLSTVTGENEAVQKLSCVQAAQGGMMHFDSFGGEILDENWKKIGEGEATIGGGNLVVDSRTYLTYKNPSSLISQPNNVVIASVDIKGGNGGLQVFVNDDPADAFYFRFSMDNSGGTGQFFAFHGTTPLALADAIPGDRIEGKEMPPVPDAEERDDYFRIEFTNAYRWPNWWQSEVNIYSLKTNMNGETEVLHKHFRRKFEIDNPKPQPGYFGVFAWDGPCSFKNFTVSAQTN